MAASEFSQILKNLKPDLLIYDMFTPWIPDLAVSYNVPAVHFQCSGAAAISYLYWSVKNRGLTYPYPTIFLKDPEIKKTKKSSILDMEDEKQALNWFEKSCGVVLIRTCKEIEEKYVDFLQVLSRKEIVPVGSLIDQIDESDGELGFAEIIQWLNKKERFSTVFVSFGSECYLSYKEMEELAYGLELSNVNFIWVIRFPGGEKTRANVALPPGFLERIKGRGMIVEGWAPQKKILGHSSVGGFVSHCGWNSVSESMYFGVPIIAIPMHNDQPLNARLAVEVGVCLEVMKDENLEFGREEVARVIKEVVVEKSGEGFRRRVKKVSEKMRMKGEEEIDGIVEELKKICRKNIKHY